jgi:hypothetical protein
MEAINYLLNLPKHISVAFNITTHSGQQIKETGTLLVNAPPEMEIKVLSKTFPPPEKKLILIQTAWCLLKPE